MLPWSIAAISWDIDPVLFQLGKLEIRYYGLFFALTIYTGFWIWQRNALRWGHSFAFADAFLWYGVVAIVAGSRLGHCLFYEPERYLKNPIEILYIWKGGLASHGATAGLFLAVWLFARRFQTTFARVADLVTPAIAVAAGGVRIGNFFNSEIVGRPWDGPWAVIFHRHDRMMGLPEAIPRHPTQVYEVLMGLGTFGVLWLLQRMDIRRAGSGLTTGVFLICYFSARFSVEFFKEEQAEHLRDSSEKAIGGESAVLHITMGHYLSILPVLVGVGLIIAALRQSREALPGPLTDAELAAHIAAGAPAPAPPAEAIKATPRGKK